MSQYIWDRTLETEKHRLAALCDAYDQGTQELLTRLGVAPGARCLEVAAGSGTIARWLAQRVGPNGRVVATDIDTRFLEGFSEPGVEVRKHDLLNDPLEEGAFDFVHARALLEHLPQWQVALGKLIKALRPGGWLLVEDFVMPPPVCSPPLPVMGKVINAIRIGLQVAGGDADFGVKLPGALAATELKKVGSEPRLPLVHTGTPSVNWVRLSVEQFGEKLVAGGLLTADERKEILEEFDRPGRTMVGPIVVAAWGSRG